MDLNIDNNDIFKIINDYLNNNITNLTSLLKKDEMKKILNEILNYPNLKENIKLPRDNSILGHEAMIGTAYDYSLRFLLSYQENQKIDNALFDSIGFRLAKNKKELLKEYASYQTNNKLYGIVNLSFQLSIYEMEFRSGLKYDFKNYKKETLNNIYNEITKLLKLSFQEIQKCNNSKIEYNPNFCYGNIIADGDLIIDKTLVDFKAVSSLNNFKDHINQLTMYFILNESKLEKYKIDSVQLYYPRFNVFPKYQIKDIISKENIKILKNIIKI